MLVLSSRSVCQFHTIFRGTKTSEVLYYERITQISEWTVNNVNYQLKKKHEHVFFLEENYLIG